MVDGEDVDCIWSGGGRVDVDAVGYERPGEVGEGESSSGFGLVGITFWAI